MSGVSRRTVLGTVLGGAAGLALGGAGGGLAATALGRDASSPAPAEVFGAERIAFHGRHQAGVTVAQAHETLVALDLLPGQDRASLRRLMRLLSDDAARLAAGTAPLADLEGELATSPARLTVVFGFGPGFVAAAGAPMPTALAPLPAFGVDRLDPAVSGGDLLIDVAADDPLAVAHALRMLTKDASAFATPRWTQRGFRTARGAAAPGTTMRNMLGQVDGTEGPHPGDADFDAAVWSTDGWLAGGTVLVARRIAMLLDKWDELGRRERELVMGRRLADGAPFTGTTEHDVPDLADYSPNAIPQFAHVRRARMGGERLYRRAANYSDEAMAPADTGTGLLFLCYQPDPARHFVPVQRRLDELDLLDFWTTPVGSAVFAIPPGCEAGGYVGETLLG